MKPVNTCIFLELAFVLKEGSLLKKLCIPQRQAKFYILSPAAFSQVLSTN